jgi:hypothetical protein
LSLAHPFLFTAAVVISLVAAIPLCRFFFGHRDQFVEDAGLSTREGRWIWAYALLLGSSSGSANFVLGTLWLIIILLAISTGAYHVLVWVFA